MSASTEKKLRAQARAEGTDKKTLAAVKEAEKRSKTTKRVVLATVLVVVFVLAVLFLNAGLTRRIVNAVSFGDKKYTVAESNYEYANEYREFVSTYGDYAQYFGLDTSLDLAGLSSQSCMYLEDGSWRDYFKESATSILKEVYVLNKYAEENGIVLEEDDLAEISETLDTLETASELNGFDSVNRFLQTYYGKGVNKNVLQEMFTETAIAAKAYNAYQDAVEVTDDMVKSEYPSVAVRHVLVKAEADEDGTYSDEALATAKAKAEDILKEFNDGDKTEESFAELAEKYSEDEGSNTNGGLYDHIKSGTTVEEFDAFCFDDSRKSGDTAIVYGDNGSYAGYHVMYFVGEGDPATDDEARSSIKSEKTSAWVEDLAAGVEAKSCFWSFLIGK